MLNLPDIADNGNNNASWVDVIDRSSRKYQDAVHDIRVGPRPGEKLFRQTFLLDLQP